MDQHLTAPQFMKIKFIQSRKQFHVTVGYLFFFLTNIYITIVIINVINVDKGIRIEVCAV